MQWRAWLQGAHAVEGVATGSSCSGGRGYRELMQWRAWLQGVILFFFIHWMEQGVSDQCDLQFIAALRPRAA